MWECLAKILAPDPKKTMIGPKNIDCIFIRYAQNSSVYQFIVYKSQILEIHKNSIIELRNVSFFKHVLLYKT